MLANAYCHQDATCPRTGPDGRYFRFVSNIHIRAASSKWRCRNEILTYDKLRHKAGRNILLSPATHKIALVSTAPRHVLQKTQQTPALTRGGVESSAPLVSLAKKTETRARLDWHLILIGQLHPRKRKIRPPTGDGVQHQYHPKLPLGRENRSPRSYPWLQVQFATVKRQTRSGAENLFLDLQTEHQHPQSQPAGQFNFQIQLYRTILTCALSIIVRTSEGSSPSTASFSVAERFSVFACFRTLASSLSAAILLRAARLPTCTTQVTQAESQPRHEPLPHFPTTSLPRR